MSATAIKVNRLALVAKLREVKEVREAEFAKLTTDYEAYKADLDKWLEGAKKHIVKMSGQYGNSYSVEVADEYNATKPKEPTNPAQYLPDGRRSTTLSQKSREELNELTATIALLELSNEDTVGQTLLKNVSKYLA